MTKHNIEKRHTDVSMANFKHTLKIFGNNKRKLKIANSL